MPRKLRQFEIGDIYHIVNRGVDKRDIFLKNQDYSRFILGLEFFNSDKPVDIWTFIERAVGGSDPPTALLAKRLEGERGKLKNPIVELLAFALMPNHYHLILREIKSGGISFFMKKIGGYSTYFNKQYKRTGSLFQSRYKSIKIEDDGQLATIFAYVHTNPVELVEQGWKDLKVENFENAVSFLENYRWSSYGDYIGKPAFPIVSSRQFFTDFFNQEKGCKQVVEDWIKFKAQNTKSIDFKKVFE
jgi:putative transposase